MERLKPRSNFLERKRGARIVQRILTQLFEQGDLFGGELFAGDEDVVGFGHAGSLTQAPTPPNGQRP